MNNKRLDEIYKQILIYVKEDNFFDKYDHYLAEFKKYLTTEDLESLSTIFKSEHLKMLDAEVPKIANPVQAIFDLVADIQLAKKTLIKYLAFEAVIFERDKYYAKSSMCKACKEIRLNAFAKYERMKSLLC